MMDYSPRHGYLLGNGIYAVSIYFFMVCCRIFPLSIAATHTEPAEVMWWL
jgi:hypothetical protein